MKKWLALLLTAAISTAMLTACSGGAQSSSSAPAPQSGETPSSSAQDAGKALEDMTFAYVASSTNDYWTRLQEGLDTAADEYGLNITTTITAEGDIAAAVAAVDAAIGQNVDGIICCAGDPDAFIDTLNTAVEKGIMVVVVDQDSPESNRQYFVGTSNYDAGRAMGEYFLSQVGDTEQKVAMFAGTITASNAVERMEGFEDVVTESGNVEIITTEQVNNDVQITMDKTYALFNGYPDVTAIYGVFAYDPLGAAKACKELGRDDVFVLGFDDLPDSIELLREGWIKAIAVQQPYEIGYTAVETMVAAVQGNGPEYGQIGTDVKIITPENVDEDY